MYTALNVFFLLRKLVNFTMTLSEICLISVRIGFLLAEIRMHKLC